MAGELKAGRYEITREVGRGGMGVVYCARDSRLGRTVALKMIPREIVHNSDLRRRLAQEARAASALDHPGVATVYDFVEQGEESFIVYQFVEGSTLREKLRQGCLSTEEVLDLGIQLTDALVAASERGIVHRDLKPENVMLTTSAQGLGHVRILDFGLAKSCNPESLSSPAENAPTADAPATAAGFLVGTVNYMAPEQLEGGPLDSRTDIYALGLLLYESATGSNPFVGKTSSSTIANILRQEAPPAQDRNPAVPLELDRILRKCLRKRCEERFQSARELLVDFSNLRRDLAGQGKTVAAEAGTNRRESLRRALTLEIEPALEIPRGVARSLIILIQVAYLVMYGLVYYELQKGSGPALGMDFGKGLFVWLFFTALAGTPLRLYLISAVGFDYSNTGRLFRQMFPVVVLFDLAWAPAPLALYYKLGVVVMLFIPALAYLPFSQRTLMLSAYAPQGGRTSGIRASGVL